VLARVAIRMWYVPLVMAGLMPQMHGLNRMTVPTPEGPIRDAYGQQVVFMHSERTLPFPVKAQFAFEAALIAYLRKLGVSRWGHRHNVTDRDASTELRLLLNATAVVAKATHPDITWTQDQLVCFVDDVVATKPLLVYEKYQLRSSVEAALALPIVPDEDVREWLSEHLDDVCGAADFAHFASRLVLFSHNFASRVSHGQYGELRVFVPSDHAYVRCDLYGQDDGLTKLSLAFRRVKTSRRSFSIECLLTSIGAGGQGGARWTGWRPIAAGDPYETAAAMITRMARMPRCRGVCQADCSGADEPDGRGWRAVNEIARTRWFARNSTAQTLVAAIGVDLPLPVGSHEGVTTEARRDSSVPPPAASTHGASCSTAPQQSTPGSAKKARFADSSLADLSLDALVWSEGCANVWRAPLCSLVCTENQTLCDACSKRLLSYLRRAVSAQAKQSGKLPAPTSNIACKLATPGRTLASFADATEQLRAVKLQNQRLEAMLLAEGIELSEQHSDVVDKAIHHVSQMNVDDLDPADATALGLPPVCALAMLADPPTPVCSVHVHTLVSHAV